MTTTKPIGGGHNHKQTGKIRHQKGNKTFETEVRLLYLVAYFEKQLKLTWTFRQTWYMLSLRKSGRQKNCPVHGSKAA